MTLTDWAFQYIRDKTLLSYTAYSSRITGDVLMAL